MIKFLVDNLGRVQGACECKRGRFGFTEYGSRTKQGFFVEGIAKLTNGSDLGFSHVRPGKDCGYRIAVFDSKSGRDEVRMYDI